MFQKWLVVIAFAALAVFSGAGAAQADHKPGHYPPTPQPKCSINVPPVNEDGRVIIRIAATSNGAAPTGTMTVRISGPTSGRGVLWSKSVHYGGSPMTVVGPRLPQGSYEVTTRFDPHNGSDFRACHGALAFGVGAADEEDEGGDGDGNGGGILPNTGGPHLLWLLLGTGLVGVGSGSVIVARRRVPATA